MPEAKFGDQTVIIPPGKPRLVSLSSHPTTLIIQTDASGCRSVQRHWRNPGGGTELCQCSPLCPSSRLDTFMSVLEWIGPLTWEQRLLCLSDSGLAQLWRLAVTRTVRKDFRGIGLIVRRHGDRQNGRVLLEFKHHSNGVPPGFDVPTAILLATHIATDFFSEVVSSPSAPNVDQTILPIRARADKPHVALGQPQRKK